MTIWSYKRINSDELCHYGIKGMRWGVRRNLQRERTSQDEWASLTRMESLEFENKIDPTSRSAKLYKKYEKKKSEGIKALEKKYEDSKKAYRDYMSSYIAKRSQDAYQKHKSFDSDAFLLSPTTKEGKRLTNEQENARKNLVNAYFEEDWINNFLKQSVKTLQKDARKRRSKSLKRR